MTKAAIAALTQAMGKADHAHQNIRVNAVCPNEVNTPMLRSGFARRGFDPDRVPSWQDRAFEAIAVEPEDIVMVAFFCFLEEARYMCGALVEWNMASLCHNPCVIMGESI